MSSDTEYEEQEYLVYADFSTNLPDELKDPNVLVKIIGIDDENPIFEVNGKLFKGTHDYAMGTNVFFEETDPPETDPVFEKSVATNYKVAAKTNKVINLKRIFVDTEEEVQTATAKKEEEPSESTANSFHVSLSYEDTLELIKRGEI